MRQLLANEFITDEVKIVQQQNEFQGTNHDKGEHERKCALTKKGSRWWVEFGGVGAWGNNLSGFAYLSIILPCPGHEFQATEFYRTTRKGKSEELSEGELLLTDMKSLRHVKQRLTEIDEGIKEAGAIGSIECLDRLSDEKERLNRYISDVSYRNHIKKAKSQRTLAKNAVGMAMKRLCKHLESIGHNKLSKHLHNSIRFYSAALVYAPEEATKWQITR
jgi:hypothetical protein